MFTEIFPIEENWRCLSFDFPSWKNYFSGEFLTNSNSCRYHWILKLLVATGKIRRLGPKVGVAFL